MDDVGLEALRVLLRHEGVLLAIEEAQLVLTVEAHQPVGIPVAGLHPTVTNVVAATYRKTVVRSMLKVKLLDGRNELVRQPLVGIQTEHPVVLGMLQRQILLRPVTDIRMHEHPRTSFLRQRHGIILAARIRHDNFIAHPLQRADARFDVFRFVQGGDDAGDHFN